MYDEAQRDRDSDHLRDPVLQVRLTLFDHQQAQDDGAEAPRAEPTDEHPISCGQVPIPEGPKAIPHTANINAGATYHRLTNAEITA
ncbi:MAG: hypothetical protein K2X52_23575 [Mycobacteriaceae bacterium]|nr:hypothetical protein [Mycobacteriaceae bacterium]